MDRTAEVSNHTYGKPTLTRFEEIFEEYKMMGKAGQLVFFDVYRLVRQVS
ncbi:lysyl-tRNA synthetase [Streptococcus pneumoniae]|nr:lysyl-tRNA synthetase [Streptococcus pneumoniae]